MVRISPVIRCSLRYLKMGTVRASGIWSCKKTKQHLPVTAFGVFPLATRPAFALSFKCKFVGKEGARLFSAEAASLSFAFALATLNGVASIASGAVECVTPPSLSLTVLPEQFGVRAIELRCWTSE